MKGSTMQKLVMAVTAVTFLILLAVALVRMDERDAQRCHRLYAQAHTRADTTAVDGLAFNAIGNSCLVYRLDP
jgi:hypothetical protein